MISSALPQVVKLFLDVKNSILIDQQEKRFFLQCLVMVTAPAYRNLHAGGVAQLHSNCSQQHTVIVSFTQNTTIKCTVVAIAVT